MNSVRVKLEAVLASSIEPAPRLGIRVRLSMGRFRRPVRRRARLECRRRLPPMIATPPLSACSFAQAAAPTMGSTPRLGAAELACGKCGAARRAAKLRRGPEEEMRQEIPGQRPCAQGISLETSISIATGQKGQEKSNRRLHCIARSASVSAASRATTLKS